MTTCTTFLRICRRFADGNAEAAEAAEKSFVHSLGDAESLRSAAEFGHARAKNSLRRSAQLCVLWGGRRAGLVSPAVGTVARSREAARALPPTAGRPITATTPGSATARLTQITPANVHQLTLAWAFQTGTDAADQGDADSRRRRACMSPRRTTSGRSTRAPARQLWRYTYPANQGFHIGHRGAAVYKDFVYLTTPDAHLVALDAKTGKVRGTW